MLLLVLRVVSVSVLSVVLDVVVESVFGDFESVVEESRGGGIGCCFCILTSFVVCLVS